MVEWNEEFRKLVDETVKEFLNRHPEEATYLGLHEYDDKMSKGSREEFLEDLRMAEEVSEKLSEIPEEYLNYDNRIDYELLEMFLEENVFYLKDLQFWRKMPDAAEHIGNAIFPLFVRDFAPMEIRMKSINSRLKLAPNYIENTMKRIDMPVKIFIEIEKQTVRMAPFFLATVVDVGGKYVDELHDTAEKLHNKFEDYESYLEDLSKDAEERFWIGKDNLQKLLKLRGIELSVEEILAIGEKYLRELKEKREKIAVKIAGSVEEAWKKIKEKSPRNFEEMLHLYEKYIKSAREFVVKSGFCDLPEGENVRVIPTPEYLRHLIPFAAYYPPPKFEEKLEGLYIITPPPTGDYGEHNEYSIANTCVHEAYPGHHTQFCWANKHRSIIRAIGNYPAFVEGWAHYCEEAVAELGYNNTDEHEFIRLTDMIWRAVRIIVDVKLSCGEMSVEEAIKFMVRETGMEENSARAEVMRYTQTQGYALSYLLGKHLIKKMREEIENMLGDKFDLRWFHNTILKEGTLPIKILQKIVKDKARELLS